ncbi:hypothetical protein BN946_scf184868.g58 [Trametes cinnabarina]|uniref:Mediator of RNA polymerase II transcription subunit 5 n=1 Tax=Pycnoporus cinnabarinus TaxID=5643 RepID=A0A060SWP0_PYCCI|nr:hypothetical protein BN946_scf184868.g58 [Trametes cinnabarina]
MFNQLLHAVESLAQPPRASQDSSAPAEEAPARPSLDSLGNIRTSLSSSSHLAESALSTLKKTLVAQRPASPANAQSPNQSPGPSATSSPKPRPATRTTLEDRLRAKLAKGDASIAASPSGSSRASPTPTSSTDHPLAPSSRRSSNADVPVVKGPPNPLSPASTPLPDSPMVSPSIEPPLSLDASVSGISCPLPERMEQPAQSELEVPAPETQGETQEETQTTAYELPPTVSTDSTSSSEAVQDTAEEPLHSDNTHANPVAEISAVPLKEPTTAPSEPEQSAAEEDASHPEPPSPVVSTEPSIAVDVPAEEQSEAPPEDGPSIHVPARSQHSEEASDKAEPAVVESSTLTTPDAVTTAEVNISDAAPPRASIDIPSRIATPGMKESERADVEALQKRLKLVEQRFADVSTSFKRLQAEKLAADRVLRELTSVESVTEVDALRDFLQNMALKNEMAQDEIRRLNGKLTRQDERIEELRDIHRLESKSQSEQIDKLKAQVEEAEKLLKAALSVNSQVEEESAKRKAEIERLQVELDRANGNAKDEEEKRTKAIALLKTVRQKLVKAEKERDDAVKEVGSLKEAEKTEREKEKAERARLQGEIEKAQAEKETAIQGIKAQFDKELAAMKDRHEKELAALRGQFELEAITTKTTHVREMENKKARISDLENTVRTLSREKDELFDQLQMRQAELESSQSALELLQGQTTELQFQLREANDRIALLQEEFSDVRHEQHMNVQSPGPSADDVARLLAAAESKYESKLGDLRRRLADAERERDESEARWSKRFAERAKEVEELKAQVASSQKSKEEESEGVHALHAEIDSLKADIRSYQRQIAALHTQLEKAAEVEVAAKAQLAEISSKAADLQQYIDESKNREAQLRVQNKTLREELRKVQSSVALLEKQRNPGVGYWASRNESTSEIKSPRSSISDIARETPSRPSTPSTVKSDEEVNFEYLRNVILQFLEHKEMRPHLWIGLCKLFISKNLAHNGAHSIETDISNSVLVLFRDYPGDPSLQAYIKQAIEDSILSLPIFLTTFLAAAQSPDLHNAATLDMLCRVILDHHYASGMPTIGSLVSYGEPTSRLMNTIQNAMALLRTAYNLPMSHFHQLTTSASELLILLLSCVTDVSQIPTTQATMHFVDANELLQNPRLPAEARSVLEAFAFSLSLLLGDDAKVAREAQMMHTLQHALGKSDAVLGASSETDIVTCTLLLNHLIIHRATDFGSGDGQHAVAILVALLRWSSWSPATFYSQLIISALTCLAQSIGPTGPTRTSSIWRAFTIGRLPHLLAMFQKSAQSEGIAEADWVSRSADAEDCCEAHTEQHTALQFSLPAILHRTDLLEKIDSYGQAGGSDSASDKSMLQVGLVEQSVVATINPNLSNDFHPRMVSEAQEAGLDLPGYFEAKLSPEASPEDIEVLLYRAWKDPCCHASFAEVVVKTKQRFTTSTKNVDTETLSLVCKMLCKHEMALDMLSLHAKITDLVAHALAFVEDYDCETIGDPQTAVTHLGDVVLFVEATIARFNLATQSFRVGDRQLNSEFLRTAGMNHRADVLKDEDQTAFNAWIKALFDLGSEGIEDNILRATHPKCMERKMDKEVLSNGISYFLGPLLNWTLAGVIRYLLFEIQRRGVRSADSQVPLMLGTAGAHWPDQACQIVSNALAAARAGRAVALDTDRCLLLCPPTKFLTAIFHELFLTATMEMDVPRRIATFVLTTPRPPRSPPLLPIFLHLVLPSLVAAAEGLSPTEQTIRAEFLVAVISSSLTAALHLEWAMLTTCGEERYVLGQSVTSMARRLAGDLKRRGTGPTATMVLQRLSAMQPFVANFPTFAAEI